MTARTLEITSPKNPIVRRFRDAGAGELEGLVLAEGVRLLGEGLDAGLEVVEAAVSPRLRDDSLRQRLQRSAGILAECSDPVFAKLSGVQTHQGVAALFRLPDWRVEDLLRGDLSPLVVAAAGVRDPGNLGALVRTAEAAGATGFVSLHGSADPFREKAVRGSMGSVFRLPALRGWKAEQVVDFAERQKLQLVVADGGGETDYEALDYRVPTLLVLGGEAEGAPEEILRAAAARVRIGMSDRVESLNVAVASGVLLFEARRQRK